MMLTINISVYKSAAAANDAAQEHPSLLSVCTWLLGLAYMSLMQTSTISTDDGEGTTISTDDEEGATISSGAGSVFYIGTAFVMMFASAISFFL